LPSGSLQIRIQTTTSGFAFEFDFFPGTILFSMPLKSATMKNKLFIALFAMSFFGANLVSAQDSTYKKSDKKELKAQKKALKGKEHKAMKKAKKAEEKAEVGR
jgi:hypothetical protein